MVTLIRASSCCESMPIHFYWQILVKRSAVDRMTMGFYSMMPFPPTQLYNRTQLGFLTVCKGAWWFLGSALNSIIIIVIIIINHIYWIKWHCGKRALWPYNKLIYSSDVQSISWWPFSHRSCYASVPIWRRH